MRIGAMEIKKIRRDFLLIDREKNKKALINCHTVEWILYDLMYKTLEKKELSCQKNLVLK